MQFHFDGVPPKLHREIERLVKDDQTLTEAVLLGLVSHVPVDFLDIESRRRYTLAVGEGLRVPTSEEMERASPEAICELCSVLSSVSPQVKTLLLQGLQKCVDDIVTEFEQKKDHLVFIHVFHPVKGFQFDVDTEVLHVVEPLMTYLPTRYWSAVKRVLRHEAVPGLLEDEREDLLDRVQARRRVRGGVQGAQTRQDIKAGRRPAAKSRFQKALEEGDVYAILSFDLPNMSESKFNRVKDMWLHLHEAVRITMLKVDPKLIKPYRLILLKDLMASESVPSDLIDMHFRLSRKEFDSLSLEEKLKFVDLTFAFWDVGFKVLPSIKHVKELLLAMKLAGVKDVELFENWYHMRRLVKLGGLKAPPEQAAYIEDFVGALGKKKGTALFFLSCNAGSLKNLVDITKKLSPKERKKAVPLFVADAKDWVENGLSILGKCFS